VVFVNTDRLFTVTEAKPKLHALVADAQQGRSTHIVKGSDIVAHLVPPTALIFEDEYLLRNLVAAMLISHGESIANTFQDDQVHGQAGEPLGHLFAWAWQTDKQRFMGYVGNLHAIVSAKLGRTLSADAVVGLIDGAMEPPLSRTESKAACHYALTHAEGWLLR